MASVDLFLEKRLTQTDPTEIKLSDLAAEASELGLKPFQLNEKLFPLCLKDEIQVSWSQWRDIREREEIRLRLMALNTHESIHESLIPFLIFYFRSSDSLLYQTAAQIIGKHLPYHKDLKQLIIEYLKERKIDPSVPLELNGVRSRRRILIALTSYCATHGAGSKLDSDSTTTGDVTISLPLDIDDLHDNLPDNHLDLSVVMLALSILSQSVPSNNLSQLIQKLLIYPGKQDVTIWDRNVIRNWGLLLNSSTISASDKILYCRQFLLSGIQYLQKSNTFSDKLQSFFELDEILKSMVHIPDTEGIISALSDEDMSRSDIIPFLTLRFNYWRLRETELDAIRDDLSSDSNVINTISNSVRLPNGEYSTDTIATLLHPLHSEHTWRLQPINERVLRTFFILSSAAQIHIANQDEIQQLITVIQPDEPDGKRLKNDAGNTLLDRVIIRLIELELTAKGQIPDSRLIQKISDENLLISLLPTEINSELLPILADAFEHRLRLLLATGSLFNVDHYIYKISIREPHVNFYRYMHEITQGREYGRAGESSLDLSTRFLQFYQDHTNPSYSIESRSNESFPFWEAMEQIRKRLSHLSSNIELFEILNSFTHELAGTGSDTLHSGSTLHDLINTTQQDSNRWIRSGFPSLWSQSPETINRKLDVLHLQLISDIQKLKPARLEHYSVAAEASHRLKDGLTAVGHLLAPSLGKNEASLLNQIILHLNQLVDQWIEILSKAGESWLHLQNSGVLISDNHRNEIFGLICSEENSHLKINLLHVFFDTLFQPDKKNSRQHSWVRQYHLLSWAANIPESMQLDHHESAEWKKNIVDHWKSMLYSAREQNNEARVAQLIKAKEFDDIRRDEEIQTILKTVKTWCFDRYDLNHAYICNRELFPQHNILRNRWTTFKEYFAHFSYVWLALIIGVILMFDFGDPWAELAEIGDIGGVIFAFILGVGGTYLYVFADLRKKVRIIKGDPFEWASQFVRVAVFLMIALIFTVLWVLLFYYMFSSTDQVVEGPYAIWHIISWTGFALFVGVFFGLLNKKV